MMKIVSRLLWFIAGLMIGGSMASALAQDTTINYKGQPPPTAMAPSVTAMGNDICAIPVSGAVSSTVIGFAGGTTITDANCERIKLARALSDQGLKVAAVAMLCQDKRVWDAMEMSGSPCPIGGSIGDSARLAWWELKPDRFKDLYGQTWTPPVPAPVAVEAK
jgi:hypothetical protein